MIKIGSAKISETGEINGTKGDSTGREVATEPYYNHRQGWFVIRAINKNYAPALASAMTRACENNNIGYGQSTRGTSWNEAVKHNYDPAKFDRCNTDCSMLVRICVKYATGKDIGNINTASERTMLLQSGLFKDVTKNVDAKTGRGLGNGDILVTRSKGHTAIVVSGASSADATKTIYATVSNCSYLNVRKHPNAGAEKCSFSPLAKGTQVEIVKDGSWPLIKVNGKRGYANGKYLERWS